MAVELLVGAVVGAGTLCVYSWRRLRNIHLYWDWRKRADAAELALREARDGLLSMSYRPATAADSELLGPDRGRPGGHRGVRLRGARRHRRPGR